MNLTMDGVFTNPLLKTALTKFGYMFYVLNPKDSSFETPEEVPNYINSVIPCFLCFMLIEKLVNIVTGEEDAHSVNDEISSVSQGIFSETTKLYQKGLSLGAYIWVYENFRVTTLPWDSAWTWFIAFILTDFIYYIVHRSGHEVNVFWAAHQAHHSSEYYNFTTALRQSAVHNLVSFYIYLPMALCVPPSAYLVHQYFNLIYQFWIHTEVVKRTGPLEYILNTPSHHRVHHGRNQYCIDKNYGGTLIIWDRIFGTFQAEEEKVVYGLVHPINTFSPFYVQLCHYQYICGLVWSTKGFMNKIKCMFYGPGWEPGKPRTGLLADIPEIHAPCERYNPSMPLWCKMYTAVHFLLITCGYLLLGLNYMDLTGMKFHFLAIFVILSMTSIGAVMDGRSYAALLELVRCLLYFALDFCLFANNLNLDRTFQILLNSVRAYFAVSTIIWTALTAMSFSIKIKTKTS